MMAAQAYRVLKITCTNESRKLNRFFIVEITPDGYEEPMETKGQRFILRRECKSKIMSLFKIVTQKNGAFISEI